MRASSSPQHLSQRPNHRLLLVGGQLREHRQRKRFMVYHLVTYNVTATGAQTYNVGLGQPFNINPRPERLGQRVLQEPGLPALPSLEPLPWPGRMFFPRLHL